MSPINPRVTVSDFKHLSRRAFLPLIPMIPAAIQMSCNNPAVSRAARKLFKAAIEQFLSYIFDNISPHDLVDLLDIRKINPRPANNRFHNKYAEPYIVANSSFYFELELKLLGFHISLNQYLRCSTQNPIADFSDLTTAEINRILYVENKYKKLLCPCSPRRPPQKEDFPKYFRICKNRYKNFDLDLWQLQYVRLFNYRESVYTAYGVENNKGGRVLLI